MLQDILRDKENDIQKDIEVKFAEYRAWLNKHPDFTGRPLTPPTEHGLTTKFRAAVTEYPPTPPASASSENPMDINHQPTNSANDTKDDGIVIRYRTPPESGQAQDQVSFRRRIGRGGRLMVDRRGMRLKSAEGIDPVILDRYRFDRDDENDEAPLYEVDPEDFWSMQYRASMGWHRADPNPYRSLQANAPMAPST